MRRFGGFIRGLDWYEFLLSILAIPAILIFGFLVGAWVVFVVKR